MKLLRSEILRDCQKWGACPGAIDWIGKWDKDYISIEDVPNENWVAWYLFNAGCEWKDERFTPEIRDALIKTGDAEFLYYAGHYWKDGRFTPAIRDALIKTGNAEYLCYAGCYRQDGRFSPEIRDALIKTGDVWYLYLAGCYWPDERKKGLEGK